MVFHFPDASFDVVLCQLGLQFFPDRLRALREMRRVLVASGRLALSVYSAIERTPARILAQERQTRSALNISLLRRRSCAP
ncbi:hypothetical protein GCM10007864_50140 [Sinorhizobium fredii]|nr:hypothetical protein GCM10007864_50140 [Sinorhizobium fredii]